MLSSMDSWLAWRTVLLGISTARPVSVLLWMAPFSLRPSPSRNTRGATAVSLHSQSLLHWQSPGEAEKVFWKTSLVPVMQHFPYSALLQQQLPSHLCNTGSALPTMPGPADPQSMHTLLTCSNHLEPSIVHWAGPGREQSSSNPGHSWGAQPDASKPFPNPMLLPQVVRNSTKSGRSWWALSEQRGREGQAAPEGQASHRGIVGHSQNVPWWHWKGTSSGKPWRRLFPLADALSHSREGIK